MLLVDFWLYEYIEVFYGLFQLCNIVCGGCILDCLLKLMDFHKLLIAHVKNLLNIILIIEILSKALLNMDLFS